jgi:hypothetical protein
MIRTNKLYEWLEVICCFAMEYGLFIDDIPWYSEVQNGFRLLYWITRRGSGQIWIDDSFLQELSEVTVSNQRCEWFTILRSSPGKVGWLVVQLSEHGETVLFFLGSLSPASFIKLFILVEELWTGIIASFSTIWWTFFGRSCLCFFLSHPKMAWLCTAGETLKI